MAVPKPSPFDCHITVQRRVAADHTPSAAAFRRWVRTALQKHILTAEITLRLVDPPEMSALNHAWRKKNAPTNVLSFPLSAPRDTALIGDIVICAQVVEQEATRQGKPIQAHWAHMVIHGMLHLQGFDHVQEKDAVKMESLETQILDTLGFQDPYDPTKEPGTCRG